MSARQFTCFRGCVGDFGIAQAIISICGVPFLDSRCFLPDISAQGFSIRPCDDQLTARLQSSSAQRSSWRRSNFQCAAIRSCHPAAFYRTLRSIKTMKKLIWLLPLLIILGAMLVTVEMKSQTHEVVIQYDYGNLVDTRGRVHSVRLVFHPDGSVTWRDLTPHFR